MPSDGMYVCAKCADGDAEVGEKMDGIDNGAARIVKGHR